MPQTIRLAIIASQIPIALQMTEIGGAWGIAAWALLGVLLILAAASTWLAVATWKENRRRQRC